MDLGTEVNLGDTEHELKLRPWWCAGEEETEGTEGGAELLGVVHPSPRRGARIAASALGAGAVRAGRRG